jgi:hypothetical protein
LSIARLETAPDEKQVLILYVLSGDRYTKATPVKLNMAGEHASFEI